MFVDRAQIFVSGGNGGNGCLSFRREKYVEKGGPDGGNGGRGGDVVLVTSTHLTTLYDLTYRPHFKAENGVNGQGANKTGRSGENLIIQIPCGTLVYHGEHLLKDMKMPGDQLTVSRGGKGGRGNASFKSSVNTAPRIAEKGEAGETLTLNLELKLLADVGVMGMPNAGKSTLLSRLTAARPKIADYPFTTLTPNLGVARYKDRTFVVADIPGLVEGAHAGKGLGDEFLRHIERTRVLVHLVDVGTVDSKTAYQNYQILNKELSAYSSRLSKKTQIVAANKMDLTDSAKTLKAFQKYLKKVVVVPLSAVTGAGLDPLMAHIVRKLDRALPPEPTDSDETVRIVLEPDFVVRQEGDVFRVSGKKVERWIQITNFDQDEAIARLQKIFKKIGVEKELESHGAQPGSRVQIGNYEFTYRPDDIVRS
ncbi:MAG TPA: GTPase ObgE [Elusimicrobiota bacterium]|nr:GTPase ObgE [Elusimicrobiota bacterium]